MEVEFLTVGEASERLGRDRSGLYRRVKNGQVLTEADRLILVDGRLMSSTRELIENLQSGQRTTHQTETSDDLVAIRDQRISQLEQELQLTRHEQEIERARTTAEIAALAEAAELAHSSAARAHELAASATRLVRERTARG